MIEFVVGMVALLVVAAFIIQVGKVAIAYRQAQVEAREEAGDHAMLDTYSIQSPFPEFIKDWRPGDDEARYSVDDEQELADPGLLSGGVTRYALPSDLEGYLPDNPISALHGAADPMLELGLVSGHEKSEEVDWMPLLRSLLVDDKSIQLDVSVYMTWTQGIY